MSILVFTYFKCLYFSHSSILKFGGGHAIKQLARESPDLSACPWLLWLQIWCLGKCSWFDKLYVEMDLVWFWRKLWWFLFVGYLSKCWILLQKSNCSCATTLSILVIVNSSVAATCALYHFGLETEHLHGHDCRNSGDTIANLELRTERHWP